jgi:hypothetical protein
MLFGAIYITSYMLTCVELVTSLYILAIVSVLTLRSQGGEGRGRGRRLRHLREGRRGDGSGDDAREGGAVGEWKG